MLCGFLKKDIIICSFLKKKYFIKFYIILSVLEHEISSRYKIIG